MAGLRILLLLAVTIGLMKCGNGEGTGGNGQGTVSPASATNPPSVLPPDNSDSSKKSHESDTSSPALTSNETSPTTSITSDPQITTSPADTNPNTTVTNKDTSSPALTSNETSPTTSIKSDKQTQNTTSLPVTHSNTTETKTTKDSLISSPLTITSSNSPNQHVTSSLPLTTAATSAVSSDTQTNTQKPEPPEQSDTVSDTSSLALTSNETSPTTSTKTDPQNTTSPADTHSNTTVTKTTKATSSPALTSNETSPTTSIKSDPQNTTSPTDTHSNTTVTITTKATSAVFSYTQTTTKKHEPPSSILSTDSTKQTKHSHTVSATSSPALTSKPNTTQITTSLPVTHSNTTVTKTTKATTPAPVQCSYTVSHIDFGFKIDITASTNGTYNINVTEEVGRVNRSSVDHSANQTLHEIKPLKPCTEYEHHVAFIESDGSKTSCNNTVNKTRTNAMRKEEIKVTNCRPGYVCYQSGWDISSVQSSPKHVSDQRCPSDNKTLCIQLVDNDYCSDLTTTVTSGSCSLNLTTSITVDFLNPNDEHQPLLHQLPTQKNPTFLSNCKNLSTVFTCSDEPNKLPKILSDLEPFTDYNCAGQIKENNATIEIVFSFRVDCDLTINYTKNRKTNTSIELSWDTISQKCTNASVLKNIYYDCSCTGTKPKGAFQQKKVPAKKLPSGGTCHFTELQPFTSYTCKVQPTYNNQDVPEPRDVTVETQIGIPEKVAEPKVEVIDHNVITVKCNKNHPSYRFNGPDQYNLYIARLSSGSESPHKLSNKTCDFKFEGLSYLTTYKLELTAFNGHFESSPWTSDVSTLYNEKALIGFLVFLIILTSVALLLVLYKIFILKRRKSQDLSEEMGLITSGNDEENLLSVEPIAGEILLETYKRKLADEGRLFLAEFQSIPRIWSRYTVKEAKKSCNAPKNRYVDILPYDYNRVQLTSGNGEAGCDYINASFIDGYKESKKYIAAQGPKEETVSDFWRMIWEQQSSIIVMVTRCEEGNRVKCAQYWPSPDRETEIYDEFVVKLTSEDHCPDYTIRRLSLSNKREKSSDREVTHIQFISWPDHGVPGEPQLLLKLRRRVNAFKNLFSGPIVVHCSAGVGRTGTYMSIDAMMEGLEAEGRVDIYGYIVKLRKQRCLMVQVEAQYILIHQALLEHNQFGETEINLPELHSALNTLKQKNTDSEPSLMEDEFDRLPTYKNWRTFNTGITEENKKKNRSSSVIPYDFNRVLLKLDEGQSQDSDPDEEEEEDSSDEEDEESTKYINASHIDGYWGPRALIAAQTPLPDTVADFWSMVYQKKSSAIVMLSEEGDKESDCVYWDKDKKIYGEVEVELVSTDTSPAFISRNMLIRHVKRKESRPVKQYQFLKWASRDLPEKPQDLTDMIKEIRSSCSSNKLQRSVPLVVHCNDGSARSGIFCALWNLLESAKTENLVDVFQVVKTLRKERQGMLPNVEQYQFLYDALEGAFPVQNGDVKAAQAPAVDSVEVVSEAKAAEQPAEAKAEQPASTATDEQQGAAENTPLVSEVKGEKTGEAEKAPPTETTPLDGTSNGPTVTVEV